VTNSAPSNSPLLFSILISFFLMLRI
jgi:hypothetical protein